MDLDPHYADICRDPLTRATLDGLDANNFNPSNHIAKLIAPILTKMGATNVTTPLSVTGHTVGFAGYHCKGGVRMGASSATSSSTLTSNLWLSNNLFVAAETTGTSPDNITAGTCAIGPMANVGAEGIQIYLRVPAY